MKTQTALVAESPGSSLGEREHLNNSAKTSKQNIVTRCSASNKSTSGTNSATSSCSPSSWPHELVEEGNSSKQDFQGSQRTVIMDEVPYLTRNVVINADFYDKPSVFSRMGLGKGYKSSDTSSYYGPHSTNVHSRDRTNNKNILYSSSRS